MPAAHDSPEPSAARSHWPRSALLCIALHVALVLIYVVLLVIASQHYEHHVNYPLTSLGEVTLSLGISVIAQTFGTVSLSHIIPP